MNTQGGAAYGPMRNLIKTSNVLVYILKHSLRSEPAFTQFTVVARKIVTLRAIARFKDELWCVNMAYDDKIVKHINIAK